MRIDVSREDGSVVSVHVERADDVNPYKHNKAIKKAVYVDKDNVQYLLFTNDLLLEKELAFVGAFAVNVLKKMVV